jgi:hypothetical protein
MKEPGQNRSTELSSLLRPTPDTEELEGDIINWQDVKKGIGR